MPARRFPPPWSVEELDACFVVKDDAGQKLAYVYFEEKPADDRPPSSNSPKTRPELFKKAARTLKSKTRGGRRETFTALS